MNRTQIAALMTVILLAGFVVFLAVRSRQAPVLPGNRIHARFVNSDSCLGACHGPDGGYPRSRNHTLRTDCLACHGLPSP
jgi:hypothetical protein